MYTWDGAVLPPDAPRADGREAIQRFWQGAIDAGLRDLSLQSVEVEEAGNIAYEVGIADLKAQTASGSTQAISLKYVIIWRRGEDGAWRLHRDIWNANPATPAT
jgi:ketosteroid isomerase-like protein